MSVLNGSCSFHDETNKSSSKYIVKEPTKKDKKVGMHLTEIMKPPSATTTNIFSSTSPTSCPNTKSENFRVIHQNSNAIPEASTTIPEASTTGSANIPLTYQGSKVLSFSANPKTSSSFDRIECGGVIPCAPPTVTAALAHASNENEDCHRRKGASRRNTKTLSVDFDLSPDGETSGNNHDVEQEPQVEEEDQEDFNEARRKSSNPLVRLMLKFSKKQQEEEKKREITLDMLQPCRYKPNNLQQMADETKFSKREVRSLYRAFKQECPNGIVDEDTFKDVYEKIFPLGDATHYAHLVFAAIDREKTGGITFGDFMEFLSVITKGSTEDKLLWAFTFYDVDHDGVISKDEMLKVTDSIHELMGVSSGSNTTFNSHAHVDKIFQTMDLNRDGFISMEEFVEYCTTQSDVRNSLMVLP